MKNKLALKIVFGISLFFLNNNVIHAQNWGFTLPSGAGFGINGKNWGFTLPSGAGFGYGGGNGGWGGGCGGAVVPYGFGAYGVNPGYVTPPRFYPGGGYFGDQRPRWRDANGWIRRGPLPQPSGNIIYPNVW